MLMMEAVALDYSSLIRIQQYFIYSGMNVDRNINAYYAG